MGLDSTRKGRPGGSIPPTSPTVGASPFSFTAPEQGTAWIYGGTVSSVTIGGVQIANATGVCVPVDAGDVVVVTYSAGPTFRFRPE